MALPDVTFEIIPNATTGDQCLSDSGGSEVPVDPVDPVFNLTVSSVDNTSVSIAWSYGDTNHDGFEIQVNQAQDGTAGPTDRTYQVTGLTPGTNYSIRVRAYNATDNSTWQVVEANTTQPQEGGDPNLSQIYYYESFQNVPLGANPKDHTAIQFNDMTCVSETPHPPMGSRSIKTWVNEGGFETGGGGDFGGWGFEHIGARNGKPGFPTDTSNTNREWWIRVYCYYPNDFSWQNNKHVKWFRTRKWQPTGDNNNDHIDMYVNNDGNLKAVTESPQISPINYDKWYYTNTNMYDYHGRWVAFEQYTKLVPNAEQAGVLCTRKFWADGVKVDEHQLGITREAGITCNIFRLHTYWDHTLPQVQYMRFAGYGIAVRGVNGRDDTPYMSRDSEGFPFIGTAY